VVVVVSRWLLPECVAASAICCCSLAIIISMQRRTCSACVKVARGQSIVMVWGRGVADRRPFTLAVHQDSPG
jgi:hypothetical protein